jgi:hypothetical protein
MVASQAFVPTMQQHAALMPAVSNGQFDSWGEQAAREEWPAPQSHALATFTRLCGDILVTVLAPFELLLGLSADPAAGRAWRAELADSPSDHTATARGTFRLRCCNRNGLDGPSFVECIFIAIHECLDKIIAPIIASLRQTTSGNTISVTSTGETITALKNAT